MPLSTIFPLYRGSQFYWWRKTEYQKKNTDKLHHLMLYLVHFEMSGFRTNNIRGECHTITTTVAPYGFWTILKNVNLVNDHPWFIHFVFAFK